MSTPIKAIAPLEFVWVTLDPFLFCVHHLDRYPRGNEAMGPDASLAGRNLGMDFEPKDGWRMYHGRTIPGFPRHPHRGFETVTLARQGFIDHSDSLGATARFGNGDVQWMTAGKGIEHCEMFPLVDRDGPNTCELFQIWMNLPAEDKMVEPHFKMLWGETIPKLSFEDEAGRQTRVTVVAGTLEGHTPPAPPPQSWAARPDSQVAIWRIALEPGAQWTLPAAGPGLNRMLYVFEGRVDVAGETIDPSGQSLGVHLESDQPVPLVSAEGMASELLLLQGRPIGEPVVQYGPFVMNTRAQIAEAYEDYQRGLFGQWPWESDDPAHPRDEGRFAIHADGKKERAA